MIGWGDACGKALLGRRWPNWAAAAGFGLAALVVLGGALDLAGLISRPVVAALTVGGAVLALGRARSGFTRRGPSSGSPPRRARVAEWLWRLAVGALLLRQAISAGAISYNPEDDGFAYLVFPLKMIERGALGPEPFSERRLSSGLGGQHFLQALFLGGGDARYLHLVDPAIALVIACGLIVFLGFRSQAPRWASYAAAALVAAIRPPATNLSALVSGLALVCMLVWLAREARGAASAARHGAAVGIVAGALASLKSSLVPGAAVFLLVHYGTRLLTREPPRRPLAEALAALGAGALAMLSWMVALHAATGTLLYPVLGRGTRGAIADPVTYESARHALHLVVAPPVGPALAAILIVAMASLVAWRKRPEELLDAAPLLAGAYLGSGLLALLLDGTGTYRFAWPFLVPAVFLPALALIGPGAERTGAGRSALGRLAAGVSLVLLLSGEWRDTSRYYPAMRAELESALARPALTSRMESDAYRRLQAAVPAGDTMLGRLEKPYLLDFSRNTVFVMDWPGDASPPPGMPIGRGAGPLALYLRRVGPRWIAYSYRANGGIDTSRYSRGAAQSRDPWWRDHARRTLAVQRDLTELGKRCTRVFDDGSAFVIDLAGPCDLGASTTR